MKEKKIIQNGQETVVSEELFIEDIQKADYTVRVVKQEGSTFFQTLQKKMLWGTDPRE